MRCECDYCIYNRNFKCIVKKIGINSLGMCDSCIIVSLEDKFLENEKVRQLNEIEKRWNESKPKKKQYQIDKQ